MAWLIISLFWLALTIFAFLFLRQRYTNLIDLDKFDEELDDLPSLAVIIPARNEIENIEACVNGILEQRYPPSRLKLIVVDDGSTDGTSAIARHAAEGSKTLEVIEAGELPPGWLGKTHACWAGASTADAEWLCFIDADTRHDPLMLRSALHAAQQAGADLLSLHPRQQMVGFWERLLMPGPFISLMILLDARSINDPGARAAMANGQFILVRQPAYLAAGGHAAIRDQVLDDVALARLLKSRGFVIKLFGGDRLIRTRMYSDRRSLWQGLARGGSELFGIPMTLLAVVTSLGAVVLPLAFPAWRISAAFSQPGLEAFISASAASLGTLTWYGLHAYGLRKYDVPLTYLLLLPLSYLLIAMANLDGVIRRLAGLRLWKGRRI